MRILFIHPNMPGQYKHLCRAFAQEGGHEIYFITKPRPHIRIPGVNKAEYQPVRDSSPLTHPYLQHTDRAVRQGQEVYRIARRLRDAHGFTPDVTVLHPGWGDGLFIRDIFPDTRILSFFEFYYHAQGADVNFNPAEPLDEDGYGRLRMKNIVNLTSLEQADWGISPTVWQWQQNPAIFRPRISILHDGIDTEVCAPRKHDQPITLPGGTQIRQGEEIVTYIARNFEPYRGFPTFMQAAEKILQRRPNARIIAIGADGVSYGKAPPGNQTYRQIWSKKVSFDPDRIHFIGYVPYDQMLQVLQLSRAHLYLTYPFVLSWSFLEAMSCGCAVIGSDTAPVREVVTDGHNGLLADFFDPEQVARRVEEALDHPDGMQAMRDRARQTIVERYSLTELLPLHVQLVKDVAAGQAVPNAALAIEERNRRLNLPELIA